MKKRTDPKPTGNQFHVYIERRDEEYVTREANPEDEWDGDDLSHEHTIEGYKNVAENESWDFILNEKPEGTWYLVCAFYSTGDSFHSEDNCLSLVSFVKSEKDANVLIKEIDKNYKAFHADDKRDFGPLKVWLPDAQRHEEVYTGTWKGYFERLNSLEVRALTSVANTRIEYPSYHRRRR